MVMEGAAMADRRGFQDKLEEARRKELPAAAVGDKSMAELQLRQQVQKSRERTRELEQEKRQLQHQLLQQRETHQEELQAANERVQQLQEQVSEFLNTKILYKIIEPPFLNVSIMST